MDYQKYIGKEIVNKDNLVGVVVSFDEERITVKFGDIEKCFSSKVVFSKHFLTFKDDTFNKEMDEEFIEKDKQVLKSQEDAHKVAIIRHKRVNQIYKKLEQKNKVLMKLFGSDFIYPPYKEFKKQYKLILDKDDFLSALFGRYDGRWKYWQKGDS